MELRFGSRTSGGRLPVDWALILVSTLTVALVMGTVIRTAPDPAPATSPRAGGLPVLAENQRLVSFEDFSFGARGWNAVPPATAAGGFASVLGPFRSDMATRRYDLPAGTGRVELALDLHLLEGWSGEGMTMKVNGTPVIEDLAALPGAHQAVVTPGRTSDAHRVWIAMDEPGDALGLQIEAAHRNAAWMVDNVSVVVSPLR